MIENEIEKKILLTKIEYERLLHNFADNLVKDTMQINHYYDTLDYTLLNNNDMLRIRQIDDNLELQFKYDKRTQNNVRIAKELRKKIGHLPKAISINGLHTNYIGYLLTERKSMEFDFYTAFLDKNYYLGKVDYEIEIEANSISDMPKELFEIKFGVNCSGKYTRFTDELLKFGDFYEIST